MTTKVWVPMVVPGPPKDSAPVEALGWAARDAAKAGRLEQYRADYRKGWQAVARERRTGATSRRWEEGTGSDAFDDGYLDASAGRKMWHLAWCLNHDDCGEG
jgi:hypothetical protein